MKEERNNSISIGLYRVCLLCFKYVPVMATLIFTLYCVMLLAGAHVTFMALGFGTSLTSCLTLYAASYTFKFCWLHRACIAYNFIMSLCINYQYVVGFGYYVTVARLAMLVTGICLLGVVVYRRGICRY